MKRFFGDYSDIVTPTLRRLLIGFFASAVGSGMTLTLLLVYLHDIRGFTNTFGGFLLSYAAVIAIAATGPIGALIDRIGPKKVLIAGLLIESISVFSWSIVTTHTRALIVATAMALGQICIWPSQTVMITRLSKPEVRQRLYGLNFMLFNLGLGFGGFFAAAIIQPGKANTFEWLYRIDSLTYFIYLAVILSIKTSFMPEESEVDKGGSYREVLSDRKFVKFFLIGLLLLIFGYASIISGLPVFTTQFLDLSPKWLGVALGANTVAIFFLQATVLRIISQRNRIVMVASVGIIWGLSWIVVGSAALFVGAVAGLMVVLSQVIFAIGEMIWAPTAPAVVNDFAPDHLRGRYNAISGLQWNISGVISPAIAGTLLGYDLQIFWVVLMVLGSVIPVALFAQLRHSAIRGN